jgi:hypothetical protein
LNGSGKADVLEETVTRLANPEYFAKVKKCFYYGTMDHGMYQCQTYKDIKNAKCDYPGCP